MRMNYYALALGCLCLSFSTVSCVSNSSGDSNSPPGDNSNGSSGDGANDNSSGTVTLRLNLRATARTSAVRVVGFVNRGSVHRADAESSVTPWDFAATYTMGSSATNSSLTTKVLQRGDTVCLVADEIASPTITTNTAANLNIDDLTYFPSLPGQFLRWEGDLTTSSIGSDKGVVTITMSEDRSIDAVFGDTSLIRIFTIGGATGTGTTLDIDFETTPLTIPPVQPGNLRNVNIVGSILTGQAGQLGITGFLNDGSKITYTVQPTAPFTSWSGDGQISGRTITVTYGVDSVATLTFP